MGGRAAPLNGSVPITVRIVPLVPISFLDLKLFLDDAVWNQKFGDVPYHVAKDHLLCYGISDYSTSSKPYSDRILPSKNDSDDNIDTYQHTPFTSYSRAHQYADLDRLLQTSCKEPSELELNASMPPCQA